MLQKPVEKQKIVLFLMIGLLIIVSGTGCSAPETVEEVVRVPVEVHQVSTDNISRTITLSGVTEPEVTAAVMPDIMKGEMVQSVAVRVGDAVSRGTVVAYLDSKTATLQYEMAQRSLEDAELALERNQALLEAGAISQSQFEQAEAGYLQARDNLKMRGIEISGYQVTSPISGVVSSVNVSAGNMASPQSPIAVISNINTLLVKTSVNETEAANIRSGQQVQIFSSDDQDYAIIGTVRSIAPTMDLQSRAFPVEIEINNRDKRIQPGTFVKAEIEAERKQNVIVIPSEAVIIRGGQARVFIISDDKAESVNIETGIITSRLTEVTSGLNEGDQLITRGNDSVIIGDLVRIVEPIERQVERVREEAAGQ